MSYLGIFSHGCNMVFTKNAIHNIKASSVMVVWPRTGHLQASNVGIGPYASIVIK